MISKELLSEVIGTEVLKIYKDGDFGYSNSHVRYGYNNAIESINATAIVKDSGIGSINVYELAHRCKKWASINYFMVASGINDDNNSWYEISYGYTITSNHKGNATTEPEAIFKACQWILDNKDKQ